MRRHSKLSAIALVIILAACGGSTLLKSFRVALASSRPLVDSLVVSGAISNPQASAIVTDFDDGAKCGLALQNEFSAIPKELPANEQKTRKFQASENALKCFRVVLQRHNFAAHPRVQNAANIAEGILLSLVEFYSDSDTATSDAVGPRRAPTGRRNTAKDEKELEKQLNDQVEALKEALKPAN